MVVTTSKMKEYFCPEGRGNCLKLKKGKLNKIKKLSKITILDEQEPSVQSADRTKAVQVWSWGNMYSPKPGNSGHHHSILCLKINSGFHATEYPSEETISQLKVVTLGSYMEQESSKWKSHVRWLFFNQQKHLYSWPCCLDNTLNRPMHGKLLILCKIQTYLFYTVY